MNIFIDYYKGVGLMSCVIQTIEESKSDIMEDQKKIVVPFVPYNNIVCNTDNLRCTDYNEFKEVGKNPSNFEFDYREIEDLKKSIAQTNALYDTSALLTVYAFMRTTAVNIIDCMEKSSCIYTLNSNIVFDLCGKKSADAIYELKEENKDSIKNNTIRCYRIIINKNNPTSSFCRPDFYYLNKNDFIAGYFDVKEIKEKLIKELMNESFYISYYDVDTQSTERFHAKLSLAVKLINDSASYKDVLYIYLQEDYPPHGIRKIFIPGIIDIKI